MTKPVIQIDNQVREMTDAEIAQLEADRLEHAADVEKAENLQIARTNALAKLEALGLTAAEIAALVG